MSTSISCKVEDFIPKLPGSTQNIPRAFTFLLYNPEGMKFCGDCGAPCKHHCPQCGFENPPRFKFCGDCGASLSAASRAQHPGSRVPHPRSPVSYTPPYLAERILAEQAAMEARGALDGERKTITALFADIKGSMSLIEDLDPEEARAIVDPALALMVDAVHRYEGYVAQSTGDGIFAFLGAHSMLRATLFSLGEFAAAREHAEQSLALYDAQQPRALAFLHEFDPRVFCLFLGRQFFLSVVQSEGGIEQGRDRLHRRGLLSYHRAL